MESILRDLRQAARSLARRPGFTAVAVLSLALGIGANSAIFSLVNGLLLRPLPHLAEPGELVRLYSTRGAEAGADGLSLPDLRDARAAGPFADVMAYTPVAVDLSEPGGRPEPLWGILATGNYFPVLGVHAGLGRTFLAEDDAGRSPVVVLGHDLWRRRFASDPAILGRTVRLNGHPFTVIGVAPAGFIGTEVIVAPDLWIPLGAQPQVAPALGTPEHARDARLFRGVARLAPGVTVAQARDRVRSLGERLAAEHPGTNRAVRLDLVPESEARIEVGVGPYLSLAAALFLGLVALVLLIACGNVANLLLARAVARRREIGVRLALGASPGQLLRQLLTESLLLSLLGGALGLLIALWVSGLLGQIRLPASVPLRLDASLDGRVLAFTLGISLLAGLVFGLVPALQASRPDLVPTLKNGDAKGAGRQGIGRFLVVSQVAVSLVLLVSAGLFLRSLWSARSIDLGLDASGVLAVSLDLDRQGYTEGEGRRFYRDLLERVRALPQSRSVSLAGPVPLDYVALGFEVVPDGGQLPPGEDKATVFYSVVDPDYFRTLGTPVASGRGFDGRDREGQPRVAVVNETLAQRFWPGQDPLGRRLRVVGEPEPLQVVGVVRDGKYRSLAERPMPYVFLPAGQRWSAAATLLVRTAGDPASALPAVRREISELDPDLALVDARPLAELIGGRTLLPLRLVAALAGAFGLVGLLLAASGLYSLMAHTVSRRTREIGIRMALGAHSADVLRLVLRQGMSLTLTGLAGGCAVALLLAQPLSGLLLGVSAFDPWTFGAVALTLTGVALLASWLPARRAARVDPIVTLKAE